MDQELRRFESIVAMMMKMKKKVVNKVERRTKKWNEHWVVILVTRHKR